MHASPDTHAAITMHAPPDTHAAANTQTTPDTHTAASETTVDAAPLTAVTLPPAAPAPPAAQAATSPPLPEPPVLLWPAQAVAPVPPRTSPVQVAPQAPETKSNDQPAPKPVLTAAAKPLVASAPIAAKPTAPAAHDTIAATAANIDLPPILCSAAPAITPAQPLVPPVQVAPQAPVITLDDLPTPKPVVGATAKPLQVSAPIAAKPAAPAAHDMPAAAAPTIDIPPVRSSPSQGIKPAQPRMPLVQAAPQAPAKKPSHLPAPKPESNAAAKRTESSAAIPPKSAARIAPPSMPPIKARTPTAPAPAAAKTAAAKPAPKATLPPSSPTDAGKIRPLGPADPVSPTRFLEEFSKPKISIETTQTVRALTSMELEDEDSMRWFVVQLSVGATPCDPDTVPNLDIFGVYRLYSVEAFDEDRVIHALRLGFFSEQIAAQAVASYLAAYYEEPTVKRVSVAERERFAEQRLEARKDVGASGKHAVIEITSELVVRELRTRSRPFKT